MSISTTIAYRNFATYQRYCCGPRYKQQHKYLSSQLKPVQRTGGSATNRGLQICLFLISRKRLLVNGKLVISYWFLLCYSKVFLERLTNPMLSFFCWLNGLIFPQLVLIVSSSFINVNNLL